MDVLLPGQIADLKSLYQILCKSPDNLLGHREISQMLTGIGIKATAQELKDLIMDVVGDEPKINFNAFVVLMTRKYKQLSFDEEVDDIFATIDTTKDGVIDASDVVELMKGRGMNVTLGEAQALLSMISDSQGGLSRDELRTFIQTKM